MGEQLGKKGNMHGLREEGLQWRTRAYDPGCICWKVHSGASPSWQPVFHRWHC
jgi:hypothetical protein